MNKISYIILIIIIISIFEIIFLYFLNINKKNNTSEKKSPTFFIDNNLNKPTPTPTLTAIKKYPLSNDFLDGVSKNLNLLINTNQPLNFILHKYALYLFLKPYEGKIKSNALIEFEGTIDTIDFDPSRRKECLDPFALVKQPYIFLIKIKKNNTYHEFCFDKIANKIKFKNSDNIILSPNDFKKDDEVMIKLDINLLETNRFHDGVECTIIKK